MNYKKIVSQYSSSNNVTYVKPSTTTCNDNSNPEFYLSRIRNSKDETLIQYSTSSLYENPKYNKTINTSPHPINIIIMKGLVEKKKIN